MTNQADGGYRPGLDGIRAIAVGAVLVFHVGRLPGGNLGVDAFFVVSGWLITWKLLAEAERTGTVGLHAFWARRVRRLMPAAIAVLLAVAIVWPLAGIRVPTLGRDVVWATAWSSNWGTITSGGDYWARFGEPSPVSHFWSLAIEEQFYFVWPIVLAVVVRRCRAHRAVVGALSLGLAVASVVAMNVMFDPADATGTYMNTFARAHSLLLGAAAASLTAVKPDQRLRGGTIARWFAPAGTVVAVGLVAMSSEHSTWMFRWGFPAFAAAMAVVVVAVADGAAARVLASKPLRWVGERSYGLYVWHWPAFLLLSPGRTGIDGIGLDVVRIGAAVALADVSYRLLEQPIRQRRVLLGRRAPVAFAAAVTALVATAVVVSPTGSASSETSVVALPPPSVRARAVTSDAASMATGIVAAPDALARAAGRPGGASARPAPESVRAAQRAPVDNVEVDNVEVGDGEIDIVPTTVLLQPLRVLVTGDSTGLHLATALIEHAESVPHRFVVGSAANAGCGLSAGADGRLHEFTTTDGDREQIDLAGCHALWDSVPQRVAEEAVDVVVVGVGPWDAVDIHLPGGNVVSVGDPSGEALVAAAYLQFAERVRVAGATIVWVTPPDTHLGWGSHDDRLNDPARWAAIRRIIDSLGVAQIDLSQWLTAEGVDGPDGRPDGVHLTPELNRRFVAEVVAPTLDGIGTARTDAADR